MKFRHDHHQGRHRDLLQGLGQRPGRHVLARLAAELRRVGRPDAVPRAERLPRRRARPARPWPVQPGLVRERHERLCRRSRGRDRGARSQGRHAGGPLHRRRRSRALHRPPRDEAGRQGGPDRRRAADHAEDRRQSGGPADGGLRRHAERPRRRTARSSTRTWQSQFYGANRPGAKVSQGTARSVLALEHAGRPQERLREHQGLLRDRLHRGPQEVRRPDPGPARRGRPDRSRQGLGDEVGEAHQGREGHLLSGRAARHHGHAPGSGQRRAAGVPEIIDVAGNIIRPIDEGLAVDPCCILVVAKRRSLFSQFKNMLK